ncbi:MAG TPA: dicarboxylate/amino acid:cation symporter [Gemmatimonadaceae bacterium]|nr:dicarboxylate/amino acid:cation symporter [Gemmatimonadaceae bacterium]
MSVANGTSGKGMPLHTKVLLALAVGAAAGVLANVTLGGDHPTVTWLNTYVAGPIGQIFLRMLFMIVVPLVFASITLGVAGLGDIRRVGRVGGKALLYFLVTTGLAASLGLFAVNVVRPGERLPQDVRNNLLATYATDATSKVQAAQTSTFGIETLVNIVPRNPLKSAVDLDLLGLIFFGIIFGAALTMIATERARPMIAVLESLNDVVVKVVEFAMKLAPYGVTALIFGVTSRFGWALLAPLSAYVAVVLGALIFHAFVTNSIILRVLVGLSPRLFFSRVRESIVTSFSTSSSSATLPTNIAVAEQNLGVPPTIAGFVLPMGATMCMNGTSLFEGITILFLAQVFGVELTLAQQAVVVFMATITAVGAAGVPGGSIPLLVGVLAMFRIPPEGIAIILGVDRILDMSRTTVNVLGDLCATSWIAKSEGVWSPAMIPAVPGLSQRRPLDETPGETLVTDADIRPGRAHDPSSRA